MASDKPSSPSIYDHAATTRFLSDHDLISEQVQVIHLADDVAVAREAGQVIRRVLEGHLLVEEGPGGIFEVMRRLRPDLGPSLDRLVQDHARIRRAVDRALALEGQPGELEALQQVATLLENHERREQAALDVARRDPA